MASFPVGKFTAAAVNATATASNTIALANFNLEFSLFKQVQPPREFSDLGNALSSTGKQEAESGKVHKTARQLSALFESLLPPTPRLEKAYGLRASEIAKASTAKEEDQKKNGVFAGRAGADGTSIWAAATSGGGAIKVHLLACMLARLWDGPEATSIWVEIAAVRKREVIAAFEATGTIDYAAHQATLDDLERCRLAEWDASARAWLRTADLRKARQQTQLELVIRNIQIPVNSKPILYESVLQAWKVALSGLEDLLRGSPQQVQSGELLLGLAAWHLYPDMVVLSSSTAVIKQEDPLFGAGVLTLGLSGNTSNAQSGVHWSLPLAYLRYYGAPVIRTRAMTEDGSRLTADDLGKAVLGCVIGGWGSDGEDTVTASQFIIDLSDKLSEALATDPQAIIQYHGSALAVLAEAASDLLRSKGLERRRLMRLIRLGRKSVSFLDKPDYSGFGLSQTQCYLELQSPLNSTEERITSLRYLVKHLDVERKDVFIRYNRCVPGTVLQVSEYATALPSPRDLSKRTTEGAEKTAQGHCRWVITQRRTAMKTQKGDIDIAMVEVQPQFDPQLNRILDQMETSVETEGDGEEDADTATNEHSENNFQEQILNYIESIGYQGEDTFPLEDEHIDRQFEHGNEIIYWSQPSRSLRPLLWTGDPIPHGQAGQANLATRFEMLCGDSQAAVFVASRQMKRQRHTFCHRPVELWQIHEQLLNKDLRPAQLLEACRWAFSSMESPYLRSLQGFATAVQLYKLMPDVSIDVRILEDPLSAALWVKNASNFKDAVISSLLTPFRLNRMEAFSCIIKFDSGLYEISPKSLSNVMAVSSGNSIFVAAPLLCDPIEAPLEQEIRRVLGNVGRPGIALLVPPKATRIKAPAKKDLHLINLDDYDGGEQDCFLDTSLHLSFTGASFPIDVGSFGWQDTEVYMLETLVSVHERGEWTADLNVLKSMAKSSLLYRQRTGCSSGIHVATKGGHQPHALTSIQSWAEFLQRPQERGIVQAYRNWQARLAVTSVSLAQDHATLILSDDICWLCLYKHLDMLAKDARGKYTIIY